MKHTNLNILVIKDARCVVYLENRGSQAIIDICTNEDLAKIAMIIEP